MGFEFYLCFGPKLLPRHVEHLGMSSNCCMHYSDGQVVGLPCQRRQAPSRVFAVVASGREFWTAATSLASSPLMSADAADGPKVTGLDDFTLLKAGAAGGGSPRYRLLPEVMGHGQRAAPEVRAPRMK